MRDAQLRGFGGLSHLPFAAHDPLSPMRLVPTPGHVSINPIDVDYRIPRGNFGRTNWSSVASRRRDADRGVAFGRPEKSEPTRGKGGIQESRYYDNVTREIVSEKSGKFAPSLRLCSAYRGRYGTCRGWSSFRALYSRASTSTSSIFTGISLIRNSLIPQNSL